MVVAVPLGSQSSSLVSLSVSIISSWSFPSGVRGSDPYPSNSSRSTSNSSDKAKSDEGDFSATAATVAEPSVPCCRDNGKGGDGQSDRKRDSDDVEEDVGDDAAASVAMGRAEEVAAGGDSVRTGGAGVSPLVEATTTDVALKGLVGMPPLPDTPLPLLRAVAMPGAVLVSPLLRRAWSAKIRSIRFISATTSARTDACLRGFKAALEFDTVAARVGGVGAGATTTMLEVVALVAVVVEATTPCEPLTAPPTALADPANPVVALATVRASARRW